MGKGKRTIKAGYVVEHPVWKTSYRLTLSKDEKPKCKGWAMVENPTAEDWRDVRLTRLSEHVNPRERSTGKDWI